MQHLMYDSHRMRCHPACHKLFPMKNGKQEIQSIKWMSDRILKRMYVKQPRVVSLNLIAFFKYFIHEHLSKLGKTWFLCPNQLNEKANAKVAVLRLLPWRLWTLFWNSIFSDSESIYFYTQFFLQCSQLNGCEVLFHNPWLKCFLIPFR